jgi:hypothetical protein
MRFCRESRLKGQQSSHALKRRPNDVQSAWLNGELSFWTVKKVCPYRKVKIVVVHLFEKPWLCATAFANKTSRRPERVSL